MLKVYVFRDLGEDPRDQQFKKQSSSIHDPQLKNKSNDTGVINAPEGDTGK